MILSGGQYLGGKDTMLFLFTPISACYLVEEFCIYIHERYWSEVLLFCAFFGFDNIKYYKIRKSLCFCFLDKIVKIGYVFKCMV